MDDNEVKRPIRRNAEIRVKVDPEMEMALADIAKARGLPPATLAAVVIGEYVEKFRTNQALQLQAMSMMLSSPALMKSQERIAEQSLSDLFANPDFMAKLRGDGEVTGKGDVPQ